MSTASDPSSFLLNFEKAAGSVLYQRLLLEAEGASKEKCASANKERFPVFIMGKKEAPPLSNEEKVRSIYKAYLKELKTALSEKELKNLSSESPIVDDFTRVPLDSLHTYESAHWTRNILIFISRLPSSLKMDYKPPELISKGEEASIKDKGSYAKTWLEANKSPLSEVSLLNFTGEPYLTRFPFGITLCENLTYLNLSNKGKSSGHNGIQALPSLVTLTQLEILILAGNHLRRISDKQQWPPALEKLDLSNTGLEALPESLRKVTSLTSINLSENSFSQFPPQLESLTQLHSLFAAHSSISSVDINWAALKELNTLDLSRNIIAKLPDTFSQATSLRELFLQNNFLMTLPEKFSALTRLVTINISRNHLMALPQGWMNLINLKEVDLSYNRLTHVVGLANSFSIERLNLAHNKITSIPKECRMVALKEVDLSYNQVDSLPTSWEEMKDLTRADFSYNHLTSLPSSLAEAPKLQRMDVSHNWFVYSPPVLQTLRDKGAAVFFEDNPISMVWDNLAYYLPWLFSEGNQ